MAINEIFRDADHVSLPVASGVKSGDPVIVGGLVGIAQTNRGEGGNADTHASVWLKGAHEVQSSFAVTDVGTPVYITSAGALTATASGNVLFGHALTTKSATAGPLVVRISN